MTAQSKDLERLGRKILTRGLPVAANVCIYVGAMIALDTDGYVRPARATATDKVLGHARKRADNTGGAAGAIYAEIDTDEIACYVQSAGADAIALVDVGRPCYVVDDQTVALTDSTGSRPRAGKIHDVTSDGVWVDFRDNHGGKLAFIDYQIADVSTAETIYIPMSVAGKIVSHVGTIQGAITGADSNVTPSILPLGVVGSAVAITGGALVVANAGSAAGITFQVNPTAANTVRKGDSVRIVCGGESTGTAQLRGTLVIAVA